MYALCMQVTAEETFISPSGQRRARLCRRDDGRFQVVTERLCEPTMTMKRTG